MAKNKRATALFEVMSKSKLPNKAGSGLATPKWWFRSTNRTEVRTLAPGQPPASPILTPQPPDEEPEIAPAAPAAEVENDPTLRPIRLDRERDSQRESQRERERETPPLTSSIDVPEPAPTAPRVQSVAVTVDSKRQQISLRLSYTSALIGGFAFVVLLALAILIGKSMTRGPSPAIANADTRTLRQNPPTAGVMNVHRPSGEATINGYNDTEGASQGARPTPGGSTGTRNPQGFNEPRPPATFFTDDPKRNNNLNYVIVQAFPNAESAKKAAQFLTENGVPATVERNLPRWRLPWADGCVVVGLRGFDKVSNNPDLERYKKQIRELGVKFAGGRGRFNAFDDPQMYKWDKSR